MSKPIAVATVKIKGREWKFILMTDRQFNKLHNPNDEGNAAMTVGNKYEVHFAKSDWSLINIRHEIYHAYFYMSGLNSTELTPLQVEETMCEIGAQNHNEIGLIADRVAEAFFNH